jgi:hypothetical protein
MKRILTSLIGTGLMLAAVAAWAQQPAPAAAAPAANPAGQGQPLITPEDFGLSVDGDLTFASKYVWRGMLRSNGAVAQPAVNVAFARLGMGTIGVSGSGNVELNDTRGRENELTEYEAGLFYRRDDIRIGGLETDLQAGLLYYGYPHGTSRLYYAAPLNVLKYEGQLSRKAIDFYAEPENWQNDRGLDAYARMSVTVLKIKDNLVRVTPWAASYYECDDISGWYFRGGATTDVRLTPDDKWRLQVAAALGNGSGAYNDAFFDIHKNAWTDFMTSVTVEGKLDEHFSVALGLVYTDIVDGALDQSANLNYGDSELFWVTWSLRGRF